MHVVNSDLETLEMLEFNSYQGLTKIQNCPENCQGKLIIASFMFQATPVFSRMVRALYCLFKVFS